MACFDCGKQSTTTLIVCVSPCAEVRFARDGEAWFRLLMDDMGLHRASDKKHDKAKVKKHTSWED